MASRRREMLWECRQFIIDNVHNGSEYAIVLSIDKALARMAEKQ